MIALVTLVIAAMTVVVIGQETDTTTASSAAQTETTTLTATTTTTTPVSLTTTATETTPSISETATPAVTTATPASNDDSTVIAESTSSTSTIVATNGTKTVHSCIALPVELKTEAFGCVVDFRLWRVDCMKDIPLPSAENRVATAQGISFDIVRCPANDTLHGRVSFRYALDLPKAIKSAADVAKLSVPDGNQLASRTVPINVTGSEVIVPIWPSSGIVELDIDGKLGNMASRKLGIALRLFNVKLNSTHVTFDVGLRVAPGATTFTDLTIARDLKFGFDDVCCLPGELLCADEKEKCMSDDIGLKKWLFGSASAKTKSAWAIGAAVGAMTTTMIMI